MKPETRTVTELFELDVRYVVPLYQRPYVWDEEDQWEPLWGDIRVLLEHQLAGTSSPDGAWSHFLGAIVLDQEVRPPGTIPVYTVIDGQQRLTTLQILLAAASKVAEEVGIDRDAALLRDLTGNNPLKASGNDLLKVWPTNTNREAFKAVMAAAGPPPDRESDPSNLIDEAYAYFVNQLAEWLADEPDEGKRGEFVTALRVTLSDLLKIVSITLEAGDNAQVIFETLNARGTPLLALDLVKNAVFHKATRQNLDVDSLYEDVWKAQLDDKYWRKERRQGRLYRPRADLFLMHWLDMKLRTVIPATELFTTFRRQILEAEPEPATDVLIEEVCRDAQILRGFDDQPSGSTEALFFQRLETLDVTTFMPLILMLFREPLISPQSRRRALRILESWLVRRTLLRLTAKNYNRVIPTLLALVAEDPSRADELILEELSGSSAEVSRWPEDAELLKFFDEGDAYGNIAQQRLVMVLAAVERSLHTKKTEIPDVPKTLTIEHVMPQRWTRNWPLPGKLSADQVATAKEIRESKIHKLGNLTLAAGSMNTGLSNSAWKTKRKKLNEHTVLLLNVRLIDGHEEVFDEAAIDKRTKWLIRKICFIWPGPDKWG